MSNNNLFRIAGISGILSAIMMVVFSLSGDPSSGMSTAFTVVSAVLGILLVAGLYLLYRQEAPTLSLAAAAVFVIGQVLFVVAGLMRAVYPSPVLVAADITVWIVGLSLFSWLAYRTRKMPRLLALVGFLAALAGVGAYLVMLTTGASVVDMETMPPVLMALYFVYLIGVVVWLAWTGISLLRMKPEAAQAEMPSPAVS